MTAPAIAPGKRAARWNPALQRHSWTKEREHHRRCDFCGVHVENRPGGGGYFQLWDWPAELGLADGDNKRDKAPVPKCPGPPRAAAPVAPAPPATAAPAGLVCKGCGDPLLAYVPTEDGLPVAIEARDPEGDLLVVEGRRGWSVRFLNLHPVADANPDRRRRRHWCIYRYPCLGMGGKCPERGRLYPTGTFCGEHVPRSR